MSRIAIIGAGAWGTALSIVLGRRDSHEIRLWARSSEVCTSIVQRRINERFLPGCIVPPNVAPTMDFIDALNAAEIVIGAMPSQFCRQVFERMAAHIPPGALIVSATKGLEEGSLSRMSEVISHMLQGQPNSGRRIGALSGPSFALDAARGDPTAVTIASSDAELAQIVQREFSDSYFRVYTNDDLIGVELGGALKNVIAIAAGICKGLGLGHNSIAGLITRGLAEMTRLVVACGGRAETMAGLAGLGDLVLTCTGGLSRNRSVGVEVGRGRKLDEILCSMHGSVAEGVFTTSGALGLAQAQNVEVPITEQIHAILHQHKSSRDAIHELMSRTGKSEL